MTAPVKGQERVPNRKERRGGEKVARLLKVCVEGSGSVVRVKTQGNVKQGGGLRGKIGNRFSQASRRRMLEGFGRRDKRNFQHCLMGTVTQARPLVDGGQFDRYMEEFHRRIERKYGETVMDWKKEWQERCVLHAHMIFSGPKWIDMDWFQAQWGAIVGEWVPFTRIERARSWKGAMAYCAKYMAKVDESWASTADLGRGAASAAACPAAGPVGLSDVSYSRKRVWGIKGRKHIIEAVVVRSRGETTPEALAQARSAARRIWPHVGRLGGWMLYVDEGAFEAETVSMILGLCAEVCHSDGDERAWWRLEVDRHREELALEAACRPEWAAVPA